MILTINGPFYNGHDRQLNLKSIVLPSTFLTSCDKNCLRGGTMRAIWGMGKKKKKPNKSRFSFSAKLDIFVDGIYSAVSCEKMKWLC